MHWARSWLSGTDDGLLESDVTSVANRRAISSKHLSLRRGQNPRNVELIWDQMWRATLPYGRKGLAVQTLSAVDLAIWDCGKIRGNLCTLSGWKGKEVASLHDLTA